MDNFESSWESVKKASGGLSSLGSILKDYPKGSLITVKVTSVGDVAKRNMGNEKTEEVSVIHMEAVIGSEKISLTTFVKEKDYNALKKGAGTASLKIGTKKRMGDIDYVEYSYQ